MQNYFFRIWSAKENKSDTGGNFVSDKFKQFCQNLNIEQATSSSYYHQSNEQAEACVKFIKYTIKCIDTKTDIHIALLQIRTTPSEPRLPNPATLLFNCQRWGIMPIMNRLPINSNNDEEDYEVLVTGKQEMIRAMILLEVMFLSQ